METQVKLGADFIVALDECTSPLHDYDYTKFLWKDPIVGKTFLERLRHPGARRAIDLPNRCYRPLQHDDSQQMFGVIQGGPFEDLELNQQNLFQVMIFLSGNRGALVSKGKMHQILDYNPHLDPGKPGICWE